MADTLKKKQENIQIFLKALDGPGQPSKDLRGRVNAEDPTIKTDFKMEDEKGYGLFWDDFYGLGLHIGPTVQQGGPQTFDASCCCSCCT